MTVAKSSVTAYVDPSARVLPQATDTSVTRFAVQDYSLNRGRFVVEPLMKASLSLGGMRVKMGPRSVSELARRSGFTAWDPADAGDPWMSVDGGSPLVVSSSEVFSVLPRSVADRRCSLLLPAVLLQASGSFETYVPAASGAWVSVALRLAGPGSAGTSSLLTLGVDDVAVDFLFDGSSLLVRSSGVVFDGLPMTASASAPSVLTAAFDSGVVAVAVEGPNGRVSSTYDVSTADTVLRWFRVGGPTAPSMLLYGVGHGTGGSQRAWAVASMFRGMVSC